MKKRSFSRKPIKTGSLKVEGLYPSLIQKTKDIIEERGITLLNQFSKTMLGL